MTMVIKIYGETNFDKLALNPTYPSSFTEKGMNGMKVFSQIPE